MKYIKLFEHTYSIYQLITMAMWEATEFSRKGRTEISSMLLEKPDILVNLHTEYGWTALMFASSNGHTEIVKMIQAKNNTI